MLTTTRGRATVAGLDSSQEYALRILLLNGTAEKLLAKRQFTSKLAWNAGVEEPRGLLAPAGRPAAPPGPPQLQSFNNDAFPVEGLLEEEMIRSSSSSSSSKGRSNKILPGGSGSGDLDGVADVLLSSSTVPYPDPTPIPTTSTTTTSLGATTGDSSVC